jgi:type IV secretory pathway TrbD component
MPATQTVAPETHIVHKVLHRPLTICGVERRMFFMAVLLGAATWNLFFSITAGLLFAGGIYGFALWAEAHDPKYLNVMLSSSRFRTRYDPAKHTPFRIEVK